jgi:acyl-CoA dehydrogenase
VIDHAIQAHGAGGMSDDFGLAAAFTEARMLRIADGPDEVHRNQIGRIELSRWTAATPQRGATAGGLAVAS